MSRNDGDFWMLDFRLSRNGWIETEVTICRGVAMDAIDDDEWHGDK